MRHAIDNPAFSDCYAAAVKTLKLKSIFIDPHRLAMGWLTLVEIINNPSRRQCWCNITAQMVGLMDICNILDLKFDLAAAASMSCNIKGLKREFSRRRN